MFKHFHVKADIFGAGPARIFGIDPSHEVPKPKAGDPRAGLLAIGRDYAGTLGRKDIRALIRVMIAEVPRFPELGAELYEKGKRPYLERLHAYLRAEQRAGTLCIADVPLAVRQFLGMINDVVFWPHMLIVDIEEADADTVVRAAVEAFIAGYGAKAR